VAADLLQPLEIITEFRVNTVGQYLAIFYIDDIFLPVKEPEWNFELRGVLHDVHDAFEFIIVQITSANKAKGKVMSMACLGGAKGNRGPFTVSSSQHRPSCRQRWSNGDQHP
jgi:hypothetical protein